MVIKTRMHSSGMHTARSLPYRGFSVWGGVYVQARDSESRRNMAAREEVTSYRDLFPTVDRMTEMCKTLPCPKLRLRAVINKNAFPFNANRPLSNVNRQKRLKTLPSRNLVNGHHHKLNFCHGKYVACSEKYSFIEISLYLARSKHLKTELFSFFFFFFYKFTWFMHKSVFGLN